MTISSETSPRSQSTGDGTTTSFAFSFPVLEDDDVLVTLLDADGAEVSVTLDGAGTYDYSISGSYDSAKQRYPNGVNVVFNNAPPSGYTITRSYDIDRLQGSDYVDNDDFPAETHERALDKLTLITQEIDEILNRTFKFSVSYSGAASTVIPDPSASKYLRWNSAADALENADLTSTTAALSDDTPGGVSLSAGSPGTSADISRKDHVHLLPTVTIAKGGTGATTAAAARTALGVVIGTDVQAFNALLADIAGLTLSRGDVLYYNGSDIVNLGPGTSGQFLQTQGAAADPQWADATSVFSESFASAEQAITTAGSGTLAHGLSGIPTLFQVVLVCQTAEQGYSIGDEVPWQIQRDDGGQNRGVSLAADATNIEYKFGSDGTSVFIGLSQSDGAAVTFTNANWKMVVRAWR